MSGLLLLDGMRVVSNYFDTAVTYPFQRPSFAVLINHNFRYSMPDKETIMKYATALLARLGLVAKAEPCDAFVARLRKIEQREAKRAGRQSLFRNQLTHQAA